MGSREAQSTYLGLVWELRRASTISSQEIDQLAQEGETLTVELKRELDLRTKSQKAEFIKDVIALANAKSPESRYLLIGFTDDGEYYNPQDLQKRANRDQLLDALSAEQIQAILSAHTRPVIQIQYTKVDYYDGTVGKLEITRDVTELPYQVSKTIGSTDRKDRNARQVRQGQVFIREGTIIREADATDIESMSEIAERAKQRQR
jgi:hypothetical protein